MKKNNLFICPVVLLVACFVLFNSCKKDDIKPVPVLTTSEPSIITTTTAMCGGVITSDGDAVVTTRGVCWSKDQRPTIAESKTTDGMGAGSFISNLTGLTANTSYYVRAYATSNNGTGYGSTMVFTTLEPITDLDGNIYTAVTIGSQIWMVENLKVTKYRNGDAIPNITDDTQWSNLLTGAFCNHNNDVTNVPTYGRLYNWYAATDNRNIAPNGWHVPTNAEWKTLEDYLVANGYNYDGTTTGNKISKSLASTTLWTSSTIIGAVGNNDYPNYRNKTGFNALPGSIRAINGQFYDIGNLGWWWTNTEFDANTAYYKRIRNSESGLDSGYEWKKIGMSIRCIKD